MVEKQSDEDFFAQELIKQQEEEIYAELFSEQAKGYTTKEVASKLSDKYMVNEAKLCRMIRNKLFVPRPEKLGKTYLWSELHILGLIDELEDRRIRQCYADNDRILRAIKADERMRTMWY